MTTPSSSNPPAPSIPVSLDGKTCSFKDVFVGAGSSSACNLQLVHTSFEGIPALMFDDSVTASLAVPCAFTLIGKFLLRRPNLDIIRIFFSNLKLSGCFSVGLLDTRHIVIQLSNDLDYSRIFTRRAYYIVGCQMRLLKWTPNFDVKAESPIAPVWISFPNLRLHLFNSQVLFALAGIFGRPLQTDQATASVSRPSVARVLVELDVYKKHPKEIWLGSDLTGYFQKVEFENVHIFCNHCKLYGHGAPECFILHPALRQKKETVSEPSNSRKDIEIPSSKIPNPVQECFLREVVYNIMTKHFVEEAMEEGEIHSEELLGQTKGIENSSSSFDDFDTDGMFKKGGKGSVIRYMQDFTLVQAKKNRKSKSLNALSPRGTRAKAANKLHFND
ncbi:hypothetical protein M5K25_023224 [Dendrobium thyrsiflorum]|uniref:DUF4283 domain-containing protein n=1 Tax=Dendrobium thyrsiflorum TaxID=117978 RepID=A0ABD0U7J2_DENTH